MIKKEGRGQIKLNIEEVSIDRFLLAMEQLCGRAHSSGKC
jgi:hypothetical protein